MADSDEFRRIERLARAFQVPPGNADTADLSRAVLGLLNVVRDLERRLQTLEDRVSPTDVLTPVPCSAPGTAPAPAGGSAAAGPP